MSKSVDFAVQERIQFFLMRNEVIQKVLRRVKHAGGHMYLVGGAARDLIWGIPLHDIDIEVHGIVLDDLLKIMREFGHVDFVGKAYGVLKLKDSAFRHIDWSIPRSDKSGRKPVVSLDPYMVLEDALRRRDLTMNAIAIDLYEQKIYDPFGGVEDMEQRILRAPSIERFAEDPLRFFRVMQFIGRFDMYPDDLLQAACKTMSIENVSQERIVDEFEKLLCFSPRPSRGIRWLDDISRLEEILPELARTKETPQSPYWHPEGTVFTHTMQALDAAVYSVVQTKDDRRLLMWGVLCHDLGKPDMTVIASSGRISSRGHEDAGVPIAARMLKRVMRNKKIIDGVKILTKYHMAPGVFPRTGAHDAAYKRLAYRVQPLNLFLLACLTYADHRGRNGHADVPLARPSNEIDQFLARAQQLGVLYGPEAPVLTGKNFIECIPEGPRLGEIVNRAYELQIAKGIRDPQQLKKEVLATEGVSCKK